MPELISKKYNSSQHSSVSRTNERCFQSTASVSTEPYTPEHERELDEGFTFRIKLHRCELITEEEEEDNVRPQSTRAVSNN